MYKPKNEKERIAHRLKISMGHLKKVIQMVEEGKYCVDVIHQSKAVQKALRETDNLILDNHLHTCAAKAIREGKEDKAIEEIMGIVKKT
ncbi:MAG TPA: metal-sensing transcriptional repressor [Candidatus Kapabacteria bacterium]|nr:metal-sensing transcriptional repressor [Candidatus Kapabacteria bacterium]